MFIVKYRRSCQGQLVGCYQLKIMLKRIQGWQGEVAACYQFKIALKRMQLPRFRQANSTVTDHVSKYRTPNERFVK